MSDLHFGNVLSDTFRVGYRSLLSTTAIALMVGIPCGVLFLCALYLINGGFEQEPDLSDVKLLLVFYAIALPAMALYCSIVIRDAHPRLLGRSPSFFRVIAEGIRSSPRMFGMWILVLIPYLLSFVPVGFFGAALAPFARESAENGLLQTLLPLFSMLIWLVVVMTLVCIWFPLFQVSIIERRMVSSFGRSASLTKGNRLPILALMLVVGAGASVLYFGSLLVVYISTSVLEAAGVSEVLLALVGVAGGLTLLAVASIVCAIQTILPTAVYVHLKRAKEGGDGDPLIDVFD